MSNRFQIAERIRNIKYFTHVQHWKFSTPSIFTNILSKFINAPFQINEPLPTKKLQEKRHRRFNKPFDPTSNEGVLQYEINQIAQKLAIKPQKISNDMIKHYRKRDNFRIVENMEIIHLSSTGKGIALAESETDPSHALIVVVPFTLKGDIINAKIGVHQETFAEGHVLDIVKQSPSRNDHKVRCKYFNSCSGCQLQMLDYKDQLNFKTDVVKNAFKQFDFDIANLPIEETGESPLQYNYRTKLTPHFNSNRKDIKIGFERDYEGRKGIFNLDSCEIATPILNNALQNDRSDLINIVERYKKSGTILLRDKSIGDIIDYTTNHREIITQRVNNFEFQFPAGEFFQNNPSILPSLISDISQYINPLKHKNIIDTYCGSGFLGISLSDKIDKLIGIEISKGNLEYANENAKFNNLTNAEFKFGSSEEIFQDLKELNPNETIVILDPSRKGSNEDYLKQLSDFQPDLVIYLSCNVFSQARDLKYFLDKTDNGGNYEITLIKGYDFFPQTKHIESLAILELRK